LQKFPKPSKRSTSSEAFSVGVALGLLHGVNSNRHAERRGANTPREQLKTDDQGYPQRNARKAVVPRRRTVLETRYRCLCHGEQAMSPRTKSGARKHRSSEVVIPDKLYFRIGEVARLCRLPAYVLRFWETEFPQLKPVKSSTGQRMYRRRDVESVLHIKKLLYEDGFTIAGARGQLKEEIKAERNQTALPFPVRPAVNVAHLRHELKEILQLLSARR
jgi:DNA-binding transcriptional MerR regulator